MNTTEHQEKALALFCRAYREAGEPDLADMDTITGAILGKGFSGMGYARELGSRQNRLEDAEGNMEMIIFMAERFYNLVKGDAKDGE